MGRHFAMKLIIHINMYVYYVYIMYIMYIDLCAHTINMINTTHFNRKEWRLNKNIIFVMFACTAEDVLIKIRSM